MWPFGKKRTGQGRPDVAATRAWERLPALQRSIAVPTLTIDPDGFRANLTAWQETGVTRELLAHSVSPDAPGGEVSGLVTVAASDPSSIDTGSYLPVRHLNQRAATMAAASVPQPVVQRRTVADQRQPIDTPTSVV